MLALPWKLMCFCRKRGKYLESIIFDIREVLPFVQQIELATLIDRMPYNLVSHHLTFKNVFMIKGK